MRKHVSPCCLYRNHALRPIILLSVRRVPNQFGGFVSWRWTYELLCNNLRTVLRRAAAHRDYQKKVVRNGSDANSTHTSAFDSRPPTQAACQVRRRLGAGCGACVAWIRLMSRPSAECRVPSWPKCVIFATYVFFFATAVTRGGRFLLYNHEWRRAVLFIISVSDVVTVLFLFATAFFVYDSLIGDHFSISKM